MRTNKHTPGPFVWKTDGTMTGRGPSIYAVNEQYDDGSMRELATLETSAVNPTRKRWRRKPDADEIEANAHLFAAAPDLLASLKAMLAQCGCDCCAGGEWVEAKATARAAIAKAEGTTVLSRSP